MNFALDRCFSCHAFAPLAGRLRLEITDVRQKAPVSRAALFLEERAHFIFVRVRITEECGKWVQCKWRATQMERKFCFGEGRGLCAQLVDKAGVR